MNDCPNCKLTDERIQKWIDHIGCSPNKFQRYDKLLEFVKMIANECLTGGGELQNRETLHWISVTANNLLNEIGAHHE